MLSDEERRRDLGAFIRSVQGTLKHLLLGDHIWMTRLEGGNHPPADLGAFLYSDFASLRAAPVAMDARIERFAADLPRDVAAGMIRYLKNAGLVSEDSLDVLLPHFFNHQTHHRAQIHTLLSQLGREPQSLDLHRVLRPSQA